MNPHIALYFVTIENGVEDTGQATKYVTTEKEAKEWIDFYCSKNPGSSNAQIKRIKVPCNDAKALAEWLNENT